MLTLATLLVVGSMSSATAQQSASKTKKVVIQKTAVVVFPTDTKGGVSDEIGDVVTDVEQSRLNASGFYDAIYFLRSQPSIQRALQDQTLTPEDVRSPFDNTTKIVHLMGVIGYSMAVVSSVDAYQYSADTHQLTFILSGRLLDLSGAKPRVIRSVTVTGDNPKNLPKDPRESLVATLVARDTTEKLMTDLLAPVKPAAAQKTGQTGSAGTTK
jgi:hypothetical protein